MGQRLVDLSIAIESGLSSYPPLQFLSEEFKVLGDCTVIWEARFAGIERTYCHMGKMANLSEIGKSFGFTVCCLPIKIKGANTGWVRPVAIVDNEG